jgi:hypothetical protein
VLPPVRLRDSTRRRARAAKLAIGLGAGWASRLEAMGDLWFCTMLVCDLPGVAHLARDGENLWRARAVRAIKTRVLEACPGPHFARLEFGLDAGLHTHLVCLEPPAEAQHVQRVTSLLGLLAYLAKPPHAAWAKPRPGKRKPTKAEKLEALREYNQARASVWKRGKRLPNLCWTHAIKR